MLRCYLEGLNVVNGVEKRYEIADGAVFIDNYNETLDSASIKIMQLTEEIDIEPYDVLVVEMTGNVTHRYCVESYSCRQTSIKPVIYEYDISLCSETKRLEGIICPNCAVTKVLGQAPRSVTYYINKFVHQFTTKTEYSVQYDTWVDFLIVPDDTFDRFRNIECPEMQWTQPTLREILNDLMMVADCIPTLTGRKIGFIEISQQGPAFTPEQESFVNYIQKSRDANDYVSEVRMNVVNAANNTLPGAGEDYPSDAVRVIEDIGFRNDESYTLTDMTIVLQTNFPIWRLFSVIMTLSQQIGYQAVWHPIDGTGATEYTYTGSFLPTADITQYILEYSEWKTRPIYYPGFGATQPASTNYQNTCLYFVRGQRNIHNFSDKQQQTILWIQNQTFVFELLVNGPLKQPIIADALQHPPGTPAYYHPTPTVTITGSPMALYKMARFKVAYDALSECLFQASKMPGVRNHRVIIDNQTNAYVDLERMGSLEYLKAKRLGNESWLINGRYPVMDLVPRLSQKLGDYIVYRREIAYHLHHVDVNLVATKDYVLRNYFTGVKSKIRSWRFIDQSQALFRNELIKFYVNDNIPDAYQPGQTLVPSHTNLDKYIQDFQYCILQFEAVGDVPIVFNAEFNGTAYQMDGIMVEFTRHKIGNSVIFTIRLPDNIYAGRYISSWNGSNTHETEQSPIRYTDANGEFNNVKIYFYSALDGSIFRGLQGALKPLCVTPTLSNPAGSMSPVFQFKKQIQKDNKEIIGLSIQFELNEYAQDMFIG